MPDLPHFKTVAIEALQAGMAVVRAGYMLGDLHEKRKADGTAATDVDRAAEEAIVAVIRAYLPDHACRGEEAGLRPGTSSYCWYIDPLDGTRYFRRRLPGLVSTEFALVDQSDGRVLVAASGDPQSGEYLLMVGDEVTLVGADGSSIVARTSSVTIIADAFIFVGGVNHFVAAGYAEQLLSLSHTAESLRGIGESYAYRQVACGRADAVIEAINKSPEDRIARVAYIRAAGGVVTTFDGAELPLEGACSVLAAATPELHAALLAHFRK